MMMIMLAAIPYEEEGNNVEKFPHFPTTTSTTTGAEKK